MTESRQSGKSGIVRHSRRSQRPIGTHCPPPSVCGPQLSASPAERNPNLLKFGPESKTSQADGVAIPRITTECVEPVCLVLYPWDCHAIRGHNPFPGSTTDRQK